MTARARLQGRPELEEGIEWEVTPPAGFLPVPSRQGSVLTVELRRPGGNPTGQGPPLEVTLTARVAQDGRLTRTA